MNVLPDTAFWLRALGVPALQALLIIALAALLAPRLRSARAQRAAWLAGFTALALMMAGNFAGMDRRLVAWLQPRPATERVFRVETNLPVSAPPAAAFSDTTLSAAGPPGPNPRPSHGAIGNHTALWWPAWLWLGGMGVVAGRKLILRGMFAWWWRRSRKPAPPSIHDEARQVARRLGMRSQVCAVEIPALVGPVAFGVLRPTIGLPSDFANTHGSREREAMLAHELAHLAARDPVWLALADAICAALWWLPPVWWAHRRLRAACEAAADEASLVVEDGPSVLADCLVTLAARLPRQGALGILGMALFRSDLGRRVERLLALRARGLRPPSGRRVLVVASLAALSAAALGVVSSAWALPRDGAEQPTLLAMAQEALASGSQEAGLGLGTPTSPGAAASLPPVNGAAPATERPSSPGGLAGSGTPGAVSTAGSAPPAAGADNAAEADQGRWMVLDVELKDPPATEPDRAALTRASMDALTRRLYALGEFSRVTCEPTAQGVSVRLGFRQDSRMLAAGAGLSLPPGPPGDGLSGTNPISTLKSLVEQLGRFEFRRVHPDSERLVQSGQCPDGYEVLTGMAAQERSPRRYVVERKAASGPTEAHIQAAGAVRESVNPDWRVSVEFTESGSRLFADLTRDAVGRMLAVVMDGEVLMAPVIRDAILAGRCEISGRFSEVEARRIAALLHYPLPAGLKLGGVVQPVSSVDRSNTAGGPVYAVNAVGYVRLDALDSTNPSPAGAPAGPPSGPNTSRDPVAVPRADGTASAVATLVQDARLLYELGKIEESRTKLEEALRQQPDNQAAKYYLTLVRESELRLPTQARRLPEVSGGLTPATQAAPTPPALSLYTRAFRLDPGTIMQSLEAMLGKEAEGQPVGEALRRIFNSLGVPLGEGPGTGQGNAGAGANAILDPAGRALFYNDRTGTLLVRATLQELDTVETALQVLNSSPPQVMLEVKFVELTQDASKALGFDWFLGNVPMGGATNIALPASETAPPAGVFPGSGAPAAAANPPPTGQVATLTGLLTDPQFRSVVRALEGAGTNAPRAQELRGDQLDWPGRSATNAANIRLEAALGATLTGILTDPQYRVALRALEQRAGTDVLAAPRVTTLSGRQAQVQIAEMRTVMTAVNPAALVQPGVAAGTNAIPYLTSAIPVGPTLDIIPQVGADGYTISLTVIPTVTEFLGYDAAGQDGQVRVWQDGQPKAVAMPLPRFRVRQMVTQAQLWDGQTLVLGGLPVEVARATKDKVPVLGDLPLAGSLFRSESTQTVRKQLLVFVTATIVDPAGNRVNSADNLPYDPNTVPTRR